MGIRKLSDRDITGSLKIYQSASEAKVVSLDPLSIFKTDLVAWYKADSGIIHTSNKVSQWLDKSGNNHHALQITPANQPTLATLDFNGKPCIKFDNLDVWLNIPNCLNSSWGEASLFIVYNLKNNTQHWDAMRTGSNTNSYWGGNSTFNFAGFFGEFRSSRLETLPLNSTIAGKHFLEVVSGVGTNNYKIYRNKINILTANPLWGVTSQPTIGKGITNKMNGDIAEIFIVKKAATDNQRQQAQEYVKKFWLLTY